jgi:hypothetical protein
MPFNTISCLNAFLARRSLPGPVRLCQLCSFPLEVADAVLDFLASQAPRHPFLRPQLLAQLRAMGREERLPHLNLYWKALDIERALILDSHDAEGARITDLNEEIPGEGESYDWVDNSGVTEHIFDQRAVFASMHNLCRLGGVMVHKIPILGVLNITLTGSNPRYLYDIAMANEYEILHLGLANRWGDCVCVDGLGGAGPASFRTPLPRVPGCSRSLGWAGPEDGETLAPEEEPESCRLPASLSLSEFIGKASLWGDPHPAAAILHALIERSKRFRPSGTGEMYSVGIFRKAKDAPFRVPYQGNNLKMIRDRTMQQRYAAQRRAAGLA